MKSALRKKLGQWLDKLAGRYAEGYDPPPWVSTEITCWANNNQQASRQAWLAFAQEMAETCWREGYVRGYEHDERLPIFDEEAEVADVLVAPETIPCEGPPDLGDVAIIETDEHGEMIAWGTYNQEKQDGNDQGLGELEPEVGAAHRR
jgi:hypothetical protein